MNNLKEQIIEQVNEFYNGDQWVSENFINKVAILTPEMALKRIPAFNHTISELVAHMTAWRNFVSRKLQGDAAFDIEDNTKSDWPDADSWTDTLKDFEESQAFLIRSLSNFREDQWEAIVPTRSYNFAYMVKGVVQHDYYHYGQIGCLIAAQQTTNTMYVKSSNL